MKKVSAPHAQQPDPRKDAYERLPKWGWFQTLLTAIYGVPHEGQQPPFRQTPLSVFLTYWAGLTLSVLLAAFAISCWPHASPLEQGFLGVGILALGMITTGRLRACHHTLLHHASHGDFGAQSRLFGESASMIAFTMPLDEYQPKHMHHHAHTGDWTTTHRFLVDGRGRRSVRLCFASSGLFCRSA